MTDRTILIIGAGIGALSTGCYAAMNGYRVKILEMHATPGGVCTAWTRDGYTFDGSIHNLGGTKPASPFHKLWRELGVVPRIAMHTFGELARVERADGDPDGEPLIVYTNLNRLEAHLKMLAPADAAVIDELIAAARPFTRFDPMALALASPIGRLGALRFLPLLLKYGSMTLDAFAQRFSDPFLRRAFPTIIYDWPGTPMILLLTFLGRTHVGDYGWPAGGSLAFARAIERQFLQLGGEIRYQARVQSILVESGRAVGVRLSDGSEERADIVVSNANGHATIFTMLGGRYTTPAIRAFYGAPTDRIEMGIHVSLGIAREMPSEPHAIVLPLDEPVTIAGEERHRLYVEPFAFEPRFAPPGKTALKVVMATSFARWEELSRAPDRYREEKDRIAEAVIGLLDQRFPGLRGQVEVIDVATPMTTLRFTGNGHGYGGGIDTLAMGLLMGRRVSQTLPGLKGFYMVGQWAGLGGIPLVAAMGRDVARAICRADGRAFATSEAGARAQATPA